jgi:hypothetical protein
MPIALPTPLAKQGSHKTRHATNRTPRITKGIKPRRKTRTEAKQKGAMDLKAIRDQLSSARLLLGPEHPLSPRIEKVERKLTPGDALWRDDAVGAERDLLAISTELELLPMNAALNEAIEHVIAAIELL